MGIRIEKLLITTKNNEGKNLISRKNEGRIID
jgi:hypothetical protein